MSPRNALLPVLLCLLTACGGVQNPFASIQLALKNKKAADAIGLVEKMRKDSVLSTQPRLYAYGVEASRRLYEQENEKIYLKRSPDTTAFFNRLYNIFDYALLTERAEQQQDSARHKFRQEHALLLNNYYPNLIAASLYFFNQQKMSDAARFSKMAIEAQRSTLFAHQRANLSSNALAQHAQRYLFAQLHLKNYAECERYKDIAWTDTLRREQVLEALTIAADAQADSSRLLRYLRQGINAYPRNTFFFTHLSDYDFNRRRPDSVLFWVDRLLPEDTTNATLYLAQAIAYEYLGNDNLCIRAAHNLLRCDSTSIEAQYLLGRSYFRQAQRVELPTSINARSYSAAYRRRQQLYTLARPHLEAFRRLQPDKVSAWRPMLYEVYLKLNLGREFEEISQIEE